MNEPLNPRHTRSGQPATGRENPLAELARIVGAEDPFANLFHDARRPPEPSRPGQRAEPQFADDNEPFAADLRGSYDHEPVQAVRSHAPARPIYDDELPPARGNLDDGFSRGLNYDSAADADDEPYAEDGYEDEASAVAQHDDPPRSRGLFAKAATLIALVVVGGGGVLAWTNGAFTPGGLPGSGGTPPVIMASDQPAKVKPEVVAAADDKSVGKDVFDRAGSGASAAPDKVVSREEQPVALSVAPSEQKIVTRSVGISQLPPTAAPPLEPAPGGAMDDGAAAESRQPIALPASAQGGSPIEPRRVKTVKVLADGTVVTGEAPAPTRSVPSDSASASASATAPGVPSLASEQADATPTTAAIPRISASAPLPSASQEPPARLAMADRGVASDASDVADDPADAAPIPVQTQAIEQPSAVPPVRPRNIPAAKPKPPETAAVEAAPAAPAPVAQPQKTLKVASLTAPIVAPAPVMASGGAWVVQVASQKTQADALGTFQGLQRKYSGVIGGMKPSIKQADLGEKGTFYRIRLGSYASRDDATALCIKLKSAGGDCVVTRN